MVVRKTTQRVIQQVYFHRSNPIFTLGLIDSKPSAAALLQDGEILAAVAEERLCRLKLASGFPRQAVHEVLKIAGISPAQIQHVAIAQKVSVFEAHPIPWQGWFEGDEELKTYRFDNFSAKLAPLLGRFPLAWQAHHFLKKLRSRERVREMPAILQQDYAITAPVHFYDHHLCHATTAYFASGFPHCLVITLDGGGDGRSGSVYIGEHGKLRPLASVDSFNSLGNFYSYITELCGFRAEKHEGKITGLAALGKPIYAGILRQLIRYQHPGQIRYSVPMYHRSALRLIRQKMPASFDPADLAASVQLVLEEIGTQFIQYWLQKTGLRQLAVAGGVFANVKFNQRVHELPEVSQFFVYPAMDDSGLAIGSAWAAEMQNGTRMNADERRLRNINPRSPSPFASKLKDMFLGGNGENDEIEKTVKNAGIPATHHPHIHQTIAQLLANGHVVARFTGRMEFGPRALGNRSILYQTNDPTVNNWLNQRLNRTEFMPFAPATLAEHAPACYHNLAGATDPARFMTITFDCTPQMQAQSPAVVHVDGTARPQIVDATTAPDFYQILTAYYQLTGIPSLINTSFNLHEEPIVCTPSDALRSFQTGHLDYLAMGNWLFAHPKMERHQLCDASQQDVGVPK